MRARKVSGVLQVTDECRETELNDWNRNRVDTLKHLKLARQVEGLQTLVTLMGDTDSFNRPYTPLIPFMDIVSCHSWPRSDWSARRIGSASPEVRPSFRPAAPSGSGSRR